MAEYYEEILTAARNAGPEDILGKLPSGIDSSVGENGGLLLGGEKQRIAVARALIRGTPVLLLDEATASLDNETAYSIEKTILETDWITPLVVTHRLWGDLLKRYDEIFVLKDGQIVERGSFEDLIQNKGYFYSLYYIEQM